MIRYRVEAIPEKGGDTLYMARRYRGIHDGPFTQSFANRLTWEQKAFAERKVESERGRKNSVYGILVFSIVEEQHE